MRIGSSPSFGQKIYSPLQVKVRLIVWDEVVLRVARNAFFGQTWLPSLPSLTQLGSTRLELPLLREGGPVGGPVGDLLLDATWKYPAGPMSNLESQGCLSLKNLAVNGVKGPCYLELRVLHQSSRGIEGNNRQLHLPLVVPKSGKISKSMPTRLAHGSDPIKALQVTTPRPAKLAIRFVVPSSLVKLGRRLRFLGFDTRMVESLADTMLVAEAEKRQMIVLEGSRINIPGACAVPRDALEIQLQHILDYLGILVDPSLMASRCAECNADKFRLASAEEVSSELHSSTVERYSDSLLHKEVATSCGYGPQKSHNSCFQGMNFWRWNHTHMYVHQFSNKVQLKKRCKSGGSYDFH